MAKHIEISSSNTTSSLFDTSHGNNCKLSCNHIYSFSNIFLGERVETHYAHKIGKATEDIIVEDIPFPMSVEEVQTKGFNG